MKIGVIREGKNPPDKRVPLTPAQCKAIVETYPQVELVVEKSPIRSYTDDEYTAQGLKLVENLDDCDLIVGVKEVNIEDLIPNKKFMFFSHTFKKQPYNRKLLNAIMDKKISLIDYETLTRANGRRIIGFGRYAGIVGCYNGFLAYGKKTKRFDLKPANQCFDRKEMEGELSKVNLPSDCKVVLTGKGRVGNGALEIIEKLGLKKVSPSDFLNKSFEEPVYVSLDVQDYNAKVDGSFDKAEFYKDASEYKSTFPQYLQVADMYIACHYWDSSAPFIFTREDLKQPGVKTQVVADISCDIDGPVASTIRPSTIADPLYGYNPQSEEEDDFYKEGVIGVMAVDNLPCELPRDASEDFGTELLNNVLPLMFGDDEEKVIYRATETTLEGDLNEPYKYLDAYSKGLE